MARKSKEESEHTYNTLLDAATELFIRQGVMAKTTLNEIASAAGMTRGAVYWHFDNKDAVIKALWERNAKEVNLRFLDALAHLEPDNPASHFRMEFHLRSVARPPGTRPGSGGAGDPRRRTARSTVGRDPGEVTLDFTRISSGYLLSEPESRNER
jgi:AcrR family transcriptional regulator